MLKRKGSRPGIRPALDLPGRDDGYRRVLKFRRSWVAAAVLAVFDAVFLVPAITTFRQAASEWSGIDSLFDLVGALFLSAWLLGWSIAPLLMTAVLVLLLFGREVIKVRGGRLVVFIGIPGIGIESEYAVSSMRNARFERPPKNSGTSWRGPHMVFDYGANTVAVGSQLSGDEMIDIKNHIQSASGHTIRRGEATQDELAGNWEPVPARTTAEAAGRGIASDGFTGEAPAPGHASLLLLILANGVPVAGALFWNWDLASVMVLYWSESAVIGFFNICKIVVIGRWAALLAAPFFAGHFGGFMAVHFLFLYGLFVKGPKDFGGGDLAEVAQMFARLWPAIAVLFVSHAYSFLANFMGRREYRGRTIQTQMSEPYRRIVFMHLVLIFGGGLSMVVGGSAPVLMLVIAVKTWVDARAHLRERKRDWGRSRPQDT